MKHPEPAEIARMVVLGVVLIMAAMRAPAASAVLSISDPDGKPIAEATAVCLEPPSAEPVASKDGVADMPSPCKRARCDAAGYLTSEINLEGDASRCTLRRGLVVAGELPASVIGSGIAFALRKAGAAGPATTLTVGKSSDTAVARFTLPAVAPGRYGLELTRAADGWSCRADLGALGAGRHSVNPAWRDPMTIAVRVKEAGDKPASGVHVRTFSGAADAVHRGGGDSDGTTIGAWACRPTEAKSVVTDDKGAASVAAPSGNETLLVAGDWKEPRGIDGTLVERPGAAPVELTLAKPVRLKAKLVDEKNRPVGCKATLEIVPADVRRLAEAVPGGGTKGTCAPDGTLTIGPFPSIAGTLSIVPSPGMSMRVAIERAAPGSTADLGSVRVKTGEAIRVMVRDPAGHPVPKAKVTARGLAGLVLSAEGTTDDAGSVDLVGFPRAASITAEVRAEGFIPVWKSGLPIAASPFTIEVTRGAVVTGTVRDRDGGPIAGASIKLAGAGAKYALPASSGADGTFALEAVPDGAYDLTATAMGFASPAAEHVVVESRRAERTVDFVLDPAAPLRGHVVTASGAAVAGARVLLVPRWDVEDLDRARITAETVSGADGAFEIAAEVEPEQCLIALHPGTAPGIERSPANAQKQGDLTVVVGEPAGLRVHYSARESSSRSLQVIDGMGIGRAAPVTGAGVTTIEGLAAGSAHVSLSSATVRDVTLVAGQTVDMALDDAPWIEGVVTADQAPAPRVLVHAGQEDRGNFERGLGGVFTDQHGAYRFDGLAEGPWRVVAIGEDGRAEKTVTLPASGPTRVDFELRMARVEVTVLRADRNEPVPQVAVYVSPAGAKCGGIGGTTAWGSPGDLGFDLQVGSGGCLSSMTDPAGVARMVVAGPGTYALSISDDAYERYDAPLGVGEGTTSRRVLLTPKTKSGKGIIHVRLLTDPPGLAGTFTCRIDGRAASTAPVSNQGDCPNFPPGPAEVLFHVEGFGAAHASVEVPDGEVTVDLPVVRGGRLVVPVSAVGKIAPEVVDATGFTWSGSWITVASGDLPDVGRAWIFDDLPPGMYTVTVDGAARNPVPLSSGGTAIAN
ncbi:MAG TPA: carboxypeptidase-like regulatory domain-containing protein [Candidatus Sulfotelmatobacter sp.]|nr:carboxypeptidase-like regulatory domain-containing protein [Candidatus Sulfotelmatobacter sp.]